MVAWANLKVNRKILVVSNLGGFCIIGLFHYTVLFGREDGVLDSERCEHSVKLHHSQEVYGLNEIEELWIHQRVVLLFRGASTGCGKMI